MKQLWVIAYDISDNRNRYYIDKALSGWGERIQYSLYECWLSEGQLNMLKKELSRWLMPEDKINYYRICRACLNKRHWQGIGTSTQDDGFSVV